jgi:hypothetical protein
LLHVDCAAFAVVGPSSDVGSVPSSSDGAMSPLQIGTLQQQLCYGRTWPYDSQRQGCLLQPLSRRSRICPPT